MKKVLNLCLIALVVLSFNFAFACEDCEKNAGKDCKCHKECLKNCDCGCKNGEKCNCASDCECCKNCKCRKSIFKFFKKKCNCK